MKNLVLCFDSTTNRQGARDATNAETLFRLLDDSADERQLTWYDAGAAALKSPRLFNPAARRWRGDVAAAARESVIDAYFYLAEHWETGDRIFLLGAGRGAYCARALARMLGTVGMMADREDNASPTRWPPIRCPRRAGRTRTGATSIAWPARSRAATTSPCLFISSACGTP